MESAAFRKIHPLVLGAAASVMIATLVGAAAFGGLLTNARSSTINSPTQSGAHAAGNAFHGLPGLAGHDSACATCGTVQSIRAVELKGNATGMGVTGTAAGNEIEKRDKKHSSYRITVRMDDGSFRTLSQPGTPAVAVGGRVRVVDGTVIGRS